MVGRWVGPATRAGGKDKINSHTIAVMADNPINGFRSQVPKLLRFVLSCGGSTIPEIEQAKGRHVQGDASQARYRGESVWHSRTDLINKLAVEMKISADYWGPQRRSADFHNMIDQEISKLRRGGMLADWSSMRHAGIFRLLPEYRTTHKPVASMDGAPASSPRHLDAGEDVLKRMFVSILARGSKANTYKFALARALLEYCRDTEYGDGGGAYQTVPYDYLAGRFLEYDWHQECKFRIKQDFKIKGTPKVIQAIRNTFADQTPGSFRDVDPSKKDLARHYILKTVFGTARSKTSLVVPKFQKVRDGKYTNEKKIFYDYDDDKKALTLSPAAFAFFKNNNALLSRVVLADWAKFLERINGSLPRLVAKVEQDEAKRESLVRFKSAYSPYMDHCFYCCGSLERADIHVDHFLPWSYIFEDEAWNLVLSCSRCNLKKSDSLAQDEFCTELIRRNDRYRNQIGILDHSLKIIDTKRGWKREIGHHYETCQEYGFGVIKMP